MGAEAAGPQPIAGNSKPWLCPACGAVIGRLVYARGNPPELIPLMPVIAIRGGVIWFRCMSCESPISWRIRNAA